MKTSLAILALLIFSGCPSPYKTMQPLPGVLSPPPEGLVLRPSVSDYDGLVYAHATKLVLGGRVSNLEHGDLALALTGSALSSGAGIAAASSASASVIAAIVSVSAALSSLTAVVNPAIRANALSEGNTLVLAAESAYFICITRSEITRVSKTRLTTCGATLIADVNSGIAATNRILVGLMPTAGDLRRTIDNQPPANVPQSVVSRINNEKDVEK